MESWPLVKSAWHSLPRKELSAGDLLISPGQVVDKIWRIDSGIIRLYYLGPDGKERNRSFHFEGGWIATGAPPCNTGSLFAAEAIEVSNVVSLSYREIAYWNNTYPEINNLIAETMEYLFRSQTCREAELLLLDATARYQMFLKLYAPIAHRIPLYHVASYLGITNVALSRIRRKLGFTQSATKK